MSETKTISILGREDSDDRGPLRDLLYRIREIDVKVLRERLDNFLQTMQEVVQSVPEKFGAFQLDTVTLAVEVSATGKISLLGTGVDATGKGGITFTLKRRDEA